MSWLDAEGYALCVSSFAPYGPNQLALNSGDRVVLLRRFQSIWFRGHLLNDESKVGIFPVSCVAEASEPPPERNILPDTSDSVSLILSEILPVLSAWRRVLFNNPSIADTARRHIQHLVSLRRSLTSQSLIHHNDIDQGLKNKVLDAIDTGSKELGLDCYVRSSTSCSLTSIDDVGVLPFVRAHLSTFSNSASSSSSFLEDPFSSLSKAKFDSTFLPEITSPTTSLSKASVLIPKNYPCTASTNDIYTALLKNVVFHLRLQVFSLVGTDSLRLPSSSSSHPLFAKALDEGFADVSSYRIYLHFFLYSLSDDTQLSETVVIPVDSDGRLFSSYVQDFSNHLFHDIQSSTILSSEVFLVVRMYAMGSPNNDISYFLKKTKPSKESITAFSSVLIPIAVGTFNLSNVIQSIYQNSSDVNIKLVAPSHSSMVPNLHATLAQKDIHVIPRITLLQPDSSCTIHHFAQLPEPCSSLLNRHEIFFTLHNTQCGSLKQDNKSSSRNIQPEVSIVDIEGEEDQGLRCCLTPHLFGANAINPETNDIWQPLKLPVIYHSDDPFFEVGLKITIPADLLETRFIRIMLCHVSTSRGRDPAFAVSFVPLSSEGYFLPFKRFPIPLIPVLNGRLPTPQSVLPDIFKCVSKSSMMTDVAITYDTSLESISEYTTVSLYSSSTNFFALSSLVPASLIPLPIDWKLNPAQPSIIRNALSVLLEAPIGSCLQFSGLLLDRLFSALALNYDSFSSIQIKNDGDHPSNQVKIGDLIVWNTARLLDHAYFDSDNRLDIYRASVEAYVANRLVHNEHFQNPGILKHLLSLISEIIIVVKSASTANSSPVAQGLRVLRNLSSFFNIVLTFSPSPSRQLLDQLLDILFSAASCLGSSSLPGKDPYARASVCIGLSRSFYSLENLENFQSHPRRVAYLVHLFSCISSSIIASDALLVPIGPWISLPNPEPFDPSSFTIGVDNPIRITLPSPPELLSVKSVETKQSANIILKLISKFSRDILPTLTDIGPVIPPFLVVLCGFISVLATRAKATDVFMDLLSGLELNGSAVDETTSKHLFSCFPFILTCLFSSRGMDNQNTKINWAIEGLYFSILKLISKFNLLSSTVKECCIVAQRESSPSSSLSFSNECLLYLSSNFGTMTLSWLLFSSVLFFQEPPFPKNSLPLFKMAMATATDLLSSIFEHHSKVTALPLLTSLYGCLLSGLSMSVTKNSSFISGGSSIDHQEGLAELATLIWNDLDRQQVNQLYPRVVPRVLELLANSSERVRDNGVTVLVKTFVDLIECWALDNPHSDISNFECPPKMLTFFVEAVHRYCKQSFITSISSIKTIVDLQFTSHKLRPAVVKMAYHLVGICQELFTLLIELKERYSSRYQLPEAVESMNSILQFSKNNSLLRLYRFHLGRLIPLLQNSKFLAEAAYCNESMIQLFGPSLEHYQKSIEVLFNAFNLYNESHLLVRALSVLDTIKSRAQKYFDFSTVSKCLTLESEVVPRLTQRLPLPAFYRVGFYQKSAQKSGQVSLTLQEYIYHSAVGDRLTDFVAKLQAEFPSAKIHQKRSKVNTTDMAPNSLVIQVTSVIPVEHDVQEQVLKCLDQSEQKSLPIPNDYVKSGNVDDLSCHWCSSGECDCRKQLIRIESDRLSSSPSNYESTRSHSKVSVFYLSRAEIIDDDDDSDKEITCLRTVFDYFVTDISFPSSFVRLPITKSATTSIGPIPSASLTLNSKNNSLIDVINEDCLTGKVTSVDTISMLLQGCIEASINGGVARYAKTFLARSKAQKYLRQGLKKDLVDLKRIVQEHFKLIPLVLKIHRKHCSQEILKLQSHLEELAKESIRKFENIFDEFDSVVYDSV
ncbi:hypothetical protein GEMRC1_000166 [Eukaryota sp. GEM-RC1]